MTNIKHVFFDLDHTIWEFEKNSQLLLFNVTGEKIGVFIINGNFEAIDISQIPSGIYFLHLINDDVNLVHRLLIR